MRPLAIAVAFAALAAQPLAAQDAPLRAVARNAASLNLLPMLVGVYSAEYARVVGEGLTLGLSASVIGRPPFGGRGLYDRGDRNALTDVKLHVYPAADAFRGMSVVLSGGVWAHRDVRDVWGAAERPTRETSTHLTPTVGLGLEFARSRGRVGDELMVVGIGFKKSIGRSPRTAPSWYDLLPVVNLSMGNLF